jgi:16S rRNA (guanine527-N7)-methyltransferase
LNPSELLVRQLAQMNIHLSREVIDTLISFMDELLRWNRRINLTAITDPRAAVEKHLVDSLTLLPMLKGDERVLDLGSGGGFPCIPLKIVLPRLRVFSVDAVQKKIVFQRHAARLLGFDHFEAFHGRAEDLPQIPTYAAGFDVVLSRAFTSLPSFAALAKPCLASGGRIVAMKGAEGERELAEAQLQMEALGLQCREMSRLRLPDSGAERILMVFMEK